MFFIIVRRVDEGHGLSEQPQHLQVLLHKRLYVVRSSLRDTFLDWEPQNSLHYSCWNFLGTGSIGRIVEFGLLCSSPGDHSSLVLLSPSQKLQAAKSQTGVTQARVFGTDTTPHFPISEPGTDGENPPDNNRVQTSALVYWHRFAFSSWGMLPTRSRLQP